MREYTVLSHPPGIGVNKIIRLMAYEYDIFLSYPRMFPYGEWVDDIFLPLFKPYINEALNKDVTIFKDSQDIRSGTDWKLKIRGALVKSRIMVSVFAPSYFRSEWCMREFSTHYHRQKTLGYLSVQNPTGLIVPIRIFDGEHFPDYARDLQMLDCIGFNRVGPCVRQTSMYMDLQGVLQNWVYDVAGALKQVPDFDSQWMDESWVESPYNSFKTNQLPVAINPPRL